MHLVTDEPLIHPADLLQRFSPLPPEVDPSLFPPALAERAIEVADSVGCDPLAPLYAGMGAACACADARSRLHVHADWSVPPILWLLVIGKPGDKKTPGSTPMMSHLADIERAGMPRYKKELELWEYQEAAYLTSKKRNLQAIAEGKTELCDLPDLPPQPVPLRLTVGDITSAKLMRMLIDRPYGMLCYSDEMSGWLRRITDPKSGEDRGAWIQAFEGRHYTSDRVGAGSVQGEVALSYYGNIQPELLRQFQTGLCVDGLLQRFLPAILRPRFVKRGDPANNVLAKTQWETALHSIYGQGQRTYALSVEAYKLFRDGFQVWFHELLKDENVRESPEHYTTAVAKLESTVLRVAFLWHLIESPALPCVSGNTMGRAIEFVQSYVVDALRYAYGAYRDEKLSHWAMRKIIQYADMEMMPLKDLMKHGYRQVEELSQWGQVHAWCGAMKTLERAGYVWPTDDFKPHRMQGGWVIHPGIIRQFAEYREDVIRELQADLEYTEMKKRKYGSKHHAGPAYVHGFKELEGIGVSIR